MGTRFHAIRGIGFASAAGLSITLAVACGGESEDSCGADGSGAQPANGAAATCGLSCELDVGCDCKRSLPECSRDSDCILAFNAGDCCGSCVKSYAKNVVENEPCLVPDGSTAPASCARPRCTDCPDFYDCSPVYLQAVCRDGRCEGSSTCPDDQVAEFVFGRFRCVSKCTSDLDCVLAREVALCCPSCVGPYVRALVESNDCLVPVGSPTPKHCLPSSCSCLNVDCGGPLSCTSGTPICYEGDCQQL